MLCYSIIYFQIYTLFSWISSLCSLVIYWCFFIISVMSISRLVRLFMIVLYLLKPVSIIHYLEHVPDNFWLFCYCLCFTIYIDDIFYLNLLSFNFLHIFVLPDVASSVVPGVGLLFIMFFIWDVPCSLTATLHIILCYKFYFVFSYDIRCISMTCMHISIYMLVCENDIFINIFNIFLICYKSHNWYFYTNALYIKFLNSFFLPDVSSFYFASFQCCISCFSL